MLTMAMHRAQGIDVSNHNPNFPWHLWHGHIDFASAKATEGLTYQDPWFQWNWGGMKSIGVFRFAYHYGHPNLDPVKQAHYLVDYVRRFGLEKHDNFLLDLEETDGRTPVEVSFWAWVFCTTVNRIAPGHRILVYTNESFADAGNCAKLGGWGWWVASYGVPQPRIAGPWRFWRFWQWTGDILDRDVYNGDEMALAQFCAK